MGGGIFSYIGVLYMKMVTRFMKMVSMPRLASSDIDDNGSFK